MSTGLAPAGSVAPGRGFVHGRWLARALRIGPTRETPGGLVRILGSAVAQLIADRLPGAPVGFCPKGGELVHPTRAELPEATVGSVMHAWLERDSVFAVLEITAERVERGLRALEQTGGLRAMGISLAFDCPELRDSHQAQIQPAIEIVAVAGVVSLDLVTRPAGDGARVLRRLTTEEIR